MFVHLHFGFRFSVCSFVVWVLGFGFRVLGFGFWVLGFRFWVLSFGCWVLVFGFWLLGFGVRGSGLQGARKRGPFEGCKFIVWGSSFRV